MDRIYGSGAAASPPAFPASPSIGYPQPANPGLGIPSTKTNPWWFYMITEEIRNVIATAGLTPNGATVNQLQAAIAAITAQSPSVQGAFNNLQASATGTNATVTVSADEIVVGSAGFAYKTLRAVALSINSATAGANGLDTGALAASTWYAVWVIYNPTTPAVAGLLSLSATAPTLPAGYTHKARVGWARTDGTVNKYPLSFKQYGKNVQYLVGTTNVPTLLIAASGIAGTINYPWVPVAVAIATYIPPTAGIGVFIASLNSPNNVMLASNSSKGSSPNNPVDAWNEFPGNGGAVQARILLESSNVYWASNAAGGVIAVSGWEDNL